VHHPQGIEGDEESWIPSGKHASLLLNSDALPTSEYIHEQERRQDTNNGNNAAYNVFLSRINIQHAELVINLGSLAT